MTRKEIQAIYAQGPEAVVALVESLWARLAEQQAQIQAQQELIAALTARVKDLEDRLVKDSHNSSKPPSSDTTKPKTRSLREASGKKPGGQVGHPGHTLRMSERPDRIIVHSPIHCGSCGTSLETVAASGYDRRQVFELPVLKLDVIEHRAEVKCCPQCGQSSQGAFPAEVTQPVQYGARVKALGTYLVEYQLTPYDRTREFFEDVFGQAVPEATVHAGIAQCHAGLAETEEQIKQGLRASSVMHSDETGFYVGGKREWAHVASTDQLTHYAHHTQRGKAATDAIDILPKFHGTNVHDGLGSYPQYTNCQHALCNAHHLRELAFVEEQQGQPWAGKMKALLLAIKQEVAQQVAAGAPCLAESTRQGFEQQYQEILDEGLAANPPAEPPPPGTPKKRGRTKQSAAKNLLDRLSQRREAVLAFMNDFRVPFDNNQAERDLRMIKVKQKISGCFRSKEGAAYFCRIRGYLSTVKKQGGKVLEAIEGVFKGAPFVPRLNDG